MNRYIVRWDNIVKSTFLYGTILRQDKYVTFENHQIPSGIKIHEWIMKSNFYNNRTKPSLPILRRGEMYQIEFNYNVVPVQGIYFKIEFYKRNGEKINTFIIKEKRIEFKFPDEAYDYKIYMISSNFNLLTFESIEFKHKMLSLDCSNAVSVFNRWSKEVFDYDKH